MHKQKKKVGIRGIILLAVGLVVLVAAVIVLNLNESERYKETRGQMTEGFGKLKTVEWDGVTYREIPAVTTLLVVGVDRGQTPITEKGSYLSRDGGPADFLMLMAIDHTDKKIYRMQIDRDTMAETDVLGVFGNNVGTRVMQICLSHNYGATPTENAQFTVNAVKKLLGGMDIDGYYMIDYNSVPVINDALGGVTVNIEFDMTSVNPEWIKGSTVTLHGEDAETFVRTRKTVGAGTNEERMIRQNEYMSSAIKLMKQKMSENLSFGEDLLNIMQKNSVSNFTQKRLLEELNQAYAYEVMSIDHPAGEYSIGLDGFVEFHMEENAAVEWVLNHLYTKVE